MAACLIVPVVAGLLLAGCQNAPGGAGTSATRGDQAAPLNKDFGDCGRRRCDFGQ